MLPFLLMLFLIKCQSQLQLLLSLLLCNHNHCSYYCYSYACWSDSPGITRTLSFFYRRLRTKTPKSALRSRTTRTLSTFFEIGWLSLPMRKQRMGTTLWLQSCPIFCRTPMIPLGAPHQCQINGSWRLLFGPRACPGLSSWAAHPNCLSSLFLLPSYLLFLLPYFLFFLFPSTSILPLRHFFSFRKVK